METSAHSHRHGETCRSHGRESRTQHTPRDGKRDMLELLRAAISSFRLCDRIYIYIYIYTRFWKKIFTEGEKRYFPKNVEIELCKLPPEKLHKMNKEERDSFPPKFSLHPRLRVQRIEVGEARIGRIPETVGIRNEEESMERGGETAL